VRSAIRIGAVAEPVARQLAARHRLAPLDQRHVDVLRQRLLGGPGKDGELEGAAGEADQRCPSLADGPNGSAVAIDRAEDVDAGAADRQPHHRGRGGAADVAGAKQVATAQRVPSDVVADRHLHAEPVGGGIGEREVVGAGQGGSQLAERAPFGYRESTGLFEPAPSRLRHRADESGGAQRPRVEQGVGDDFELVAAEASLGAVEGRRAAQLAD